MADELYKVHLAVGQTLDRMDFPLDTVFAIFDRMRTWSEADVSSFYANTYSHLRSKYMSGNLKGMRDVIDDILTGDV